MQDTPSVRLRNDEYNRYIQEYKEECIFDKTNKISPLEQVIIVRCCEDYGLEQKNPVVQTVDESEPEKRYSLILYVKGNYTLPAETHLSTDRGNLLVKPFIIHDTIVAQRMRIVAHLLFEKKEIESVVTIDEDYLYEALRETSFALSLEMIDKWGKGAQSLQIVFDETGHFKASDFDSD